MSSAAAATRQFIRFRGRSFMAFVLEPEADVAGWLAELDETLRRSVGFFVGKPVILDVSRLSLLKQELRDLLDALHAREIRVLGIEGADPELLDASFPPLLKGGKTAAAVQQPERKQPERKAAEPIPAPVAPKQSLIVDQPVRSGQSIVFLQGDVTVLGSVGSGAEVVAGGSIHVYGALRGRALAGARGNPAARIFCSRGEPELLGIDCVYMTADDVAPALRGRSMQVWYENETIRIAPLD